MSKSAYYYYVLGYIEGLKSNNPKEDKNVAIDKFIEDHREDGWLLIEVNYKDSNASLLVSRSAYESFINMFQLDRGYSNYEDAKDDWESGNHNDLETYALIELFASESDDNEFINIRYLRDK